MAGRPGRPGEFPDGSTTTAVRFANPVYFAMREFHEETGIPIRRLIEDGVVMLLESRGKNVQLNRGRVPPRTREEVAEANGELDDAATGKTPLAKTKTHAKAPKKTVKKEAEKPQEPPKPTSEAIKEAQKPQEPAVEAPATKGRGRAVITKKGGQPAAKAS